MKEAHVMASQKVTYLSVDLDENINASYENALRQVENDFGLHHPMHIGDKATFSPRPETKDKSPIDDQIVLGFFQNGTGRDVRNAIKTASDGFTEWSRRDWKDRISILRKAADGIDSRRFYLSALITYEVGKNRNEAVAEVNGAAEMIRYYAGLLESNEGYVVGTATTSSSEKATSLLKPYGVWVVISPFNFPLSLATGMITGALITGNSVVFKPSTEAPYVGLALHDVLVEAGVPPAVINFVTCHGQTFGEIVQNPQVGGMSFTGSRAVGMRLFRDFSIHQPFPKPFVAEMGSKNPALVSSKADLERAAEGVYRGAFGFCGQKCSATSRVFVQNDVMRDFIGLLKSNVEAMTIGDPREKDIFMGPIINSNAQGRYERSAHTASAAGGNIAASGKIPAGKQFARGRYVAPLVVKGLNHHHPLFRNELFLPVLLIDGFRELEEGIIKANDTEFGLSAAIFSEDPDEISYFFREIKFGVTYSNRRGGATTGAWPGTQSFGGWKTSGSTGKGVGGPYYLLQFVREQSQTVCS